MSRRRQRERGASATQRRRGADVRRDDRGRRRGAAGIDALRGVAILLMIAYHFCFDLRSTA